MLASVVRLISSIVSFIILIVIGIVLYNKYKKEGFCISQAPRMEYESYYRSGFPENSVYKDSFKIFLDKVDEDKKNNGSILGSVQNPMSDRDHNTRILYQEGQDVYKF